MKSSNRCNLLAPRGAGIFLCTKQNIPTWPIKYQTVINLFECHHFKFKLKPQCTQFITCWFTLQPYFSVLKRGILWRSPINPHWQPQVEFLKDSGTKIIPQIFLPGPHMGQGPTLFKLGCSKWEPYEFMLVWEEEARPTERSTLSLLWGLWGAFSLPTEQNWTFSKCLKKKSPQSLHLGPLNSFLSFQFGQRAWITSHPPLSLCPLQMQKTVRFWPASKAGLIPLANSIL